ncbi:MAG TPA: OstA-like protein, partial [Bacteroidota bacterium]|nr:OstA-like protein [Bacteroidota bacterium]
MIEHADSLVARMIEGEQARELIGNVRFSQDRVHVSCQRAIQFQGSGNVELEGNVVIVEDSLTMNFPRGMYFREARIAVAYDSVRLD